MSSGSALWGFAWGWEAAGCVWSERERKCVCVNVCMRERERDQYRSSSAAVAVKWWCSPTTAASFSSPYTPPPTLSLSPALCLSHIFLHFLFSHKPIPPFLSRSLLHTGTPPLPSIWKWSLVVSPSHSRCPSATQTLQAPCLIPSSVMMLFMALILI